MGGRGTGRGTPYCTPLPVGAINGIPMCLDGCKEFSRLWREISKISIRKNSQECEILLPYMCVWCVCVFFLFVLVCPFECVCPHILSLAACVLRQVQVELQSRSHRVEGELSFGERECDQGPLTILFKVEFPFYLIFLIFFSYNPWSLIAPYFKYI